MRVECFYGVENYTQVVKSQNWISSYYWNGKDDNNYRDYSWDNGVSFSRALKLATEGDLSLVQETSATVDKLVQNFQIQQEVRQKYIPSIAGSRVSIPDYLGGSPFCMRKRAAQEISVRHVNIYVATTCSAGIGAKDMLKRGCTILAFLEYLQMTQVGVRLFLTAETHGRTNGDFIQVIEVENNPLDLSTASFAIAHPAFARHLTYGLAERMDGFNGSWGKTWDKYRKWNSTATSSEYVKVLGQAIGMDAHDIYVPAPYLYDEVINQPEKWLERHIRQLSSGVES